MYSTRIVSALTALLPFVDIVTAQCAGQPKLQFDNAVLGPGWEMGVVATGLTAPRGIKFDTAGNLIVVEQITGLKSLKLSDKGGVCVTATKADVISGEDGVTHGLEISADGKTMYASTLDLLFAWDYDAATGKLTNKRTIVSGMDGSDHVTRTLLLSKTKPNALIVSRGSFANIDVPTISKDSGRSMIKMFDLSKAAGKTYDYTNDGEIIGWGLRNDIGVAEHPSTSGIWAVENGPDEIKRNGVDIHNDNPAERLNFIGYMNGKASKNWGSNFGYPVCYAAWNTTSFKLAPTNSHSAQASSFVPGKLFTSEPNATINDATCAERTPPRIVFQPHMAPIDIKFDTAGTTAYVSFHGSWNKDLPSGYKVSYLDFANGEPTAPVTSLDAIKDIFYVKDTTVCPDGCFRPTGMAIDKQGRLFVASDGTGEIIVLQRKGASASAKPASRAAEVAPFGGSIRQAVVQAAQIVCSTLWLCSV